MYRNEAPQTSRSKPVPSAQVHVLSTSDLYAEYEEQFHQMEGAHSDRSQQAAQQHPDRRSHQQAAPQRPDLPARQQAAHHPQRPNQIQPQPRHVHQAQHHGVVEQTQAPRSSKYHDFFSLKIHGTKAALNFVPDVTRKNFLTVSLEAAEILNPASRTYNWQNKSRVQLTRGEFLEVVAVLLGIGANCQCRFDNHGPQGGPKKGFQIQHQGSKVFVSVFEANKPAKAVPIPLMEAIQIAHMMISVYIDNYPGLTSDTVLTSLSLSLRKRDSTAGNVSAGRA